MPLTDLVKLALSSRAAMAEGIAAEEAYKRARKGWGNSIAKEARNLAPVEEGDYKDHIEVDEEGSVGSTWFTAHFVEWGTVYTPARGVMKRAVEAAGFGFRETPKA